MLLLGRALRIFGSVTCAFWLVGGPSAAQNPVSSASPNSTPTFHTSSNLVVVNVVVTDRDGKPILGLGKEDFDLIEDGKVQSLQVFESHVASSSPSVVPDLHATPHENTSSPKLAADGAINVILFDMLNTPAEDQAYARQEIIEFLKTLPHGQPIALFTLNNELRMEGDFATSIQDLIAAVKNLRPDVSSMFLDRNHERPESNFYSAAYDWPTSGDPMPPVGNETARWWRDLRTQETLEAMREIAGALSGYAGRKNLLWLSGGFFGALPPNLKQPRFESSDLLAIFQKYSGTLESSQISVYPIDLRGLKRTGRPGIPESSDHVFLRIDGQRGMDEVAAQTGGRAFYNANDVESAMQRSVEHGATYYTLVYSPRNQKWNGAFRRITVKINRPSVRLDYREGYYGTKDRVSQTSH